MIAAQTPMVTLMLAGLALVLALFVCAAIGFARLAYRSERGWRSQAREAAARAALAESALIEIRQKRSIATAKGNRTRGELQRARRDAMTQQLRRDTAIRKAGGQLPMPFDATPPAPPETRA